MIPPIQIDRAKYERDELFQSTAFACGNHEVSCLILLQHTPHGVDIFWGPPPVANYTELSELQSKLLPGCNGEAPHSKHGGAKLNEA